MNPLSTVQIRTVCFGSQLVGGLLSKTADTDLSHRQLGKSLLLFSAQLSHCRTTLRLFDDLAMLAYSHSYGVGVRVRGDSTLKRFWSSYLTFIIIVLNGIAVCVNIRSSVLLDYSIWQFHACHMSLTGGWSSRALDIGAEQRGRPALLPLWAHRLGRWCRAHQNKVWQVVAVQYGAVGSVAAAGDSQVRHHLSKKHIYGSHSCSDKTDCSRPTLGVKW